MHRLVNIVPFHSHPMGPPHLGLRSIEPFKKNFNKLESYRSYRLMVTRDTRSSRDTAKVRIHIKNLNHTMKSHCFDGIDKIKVFELLTIFVNEADMIYMLEAQAFIALPTFLDDPTETQFRTNFSVTSRHGGITCWPEDILYWLGTYETASAIGRP